MLQRYRFQVYLRQTAHKHVKGEVSTTDIEMDVKRQFGIDIAGKLAELQEPMVKSRVCTIRPLRSCATRHTPASGSLAPTAHGENPHFLLPQEIYGKAVAALEGKPGYREVLAIPDDRPEVKQASDDFKVVYAQAEMARGLLRNALADEWFVDEERKQLGKTDFYYPVAEKKRAWVDQAIDPGVKGAVRAKEKMKNDYSGHANMLKDLARMTLKYKGCDRMATSIQELKKAGFSVVVSKNKYLSPTVRSERLPPIPPAPTSSYSVLHLCTANGLL